MSPARRPHLAVVRAGNPGHEAADRTEGRKGLQLPSAAPAEPDWREWFPVVRGDKERAKVMTRCREVARAEWRRVVPVLDASGQLATIDRAVLVDLCVTVARLDQCERQVSAEGLLVEGQKGGSRNGAGIFARQYREHLRWLVGELGLSPSARQRLSGTPAGAAAGEEGDSPYDV